MKHQLEQKTKSHQNRNVIVPDVGRKLVFDNNDYRHEVLHNRGASKCG